jgi:hypothetical protein
MPLSSTAVLSDAFFEGMKRGLQERQSPVYSRFGILRGPGDLATLMKLRGTGRLSKESQAKIDKFLKDRARKAVTEWKNWLGLRRGRIRNALREKVWIYAALLQKKDPHRYSWRKLAQMFDADGCQRDERLAMDRIRHGVESVLKRGYLNRVSP